MAVIAQAAGRLSEDVSVGRVVEFAVVFGLIWIAWVNGTLYLELHGREDGGLSPQDSSRTEQVATILMVS